MRRREGAARGDERGGPAAYALYRMSLGFDRGISVGALHVEEAHPGALARATALFHTTIAPQ